ncbi:uncharacterized protein LOC131620959 isoform X2 [Vicia villosa]|uniref:uncharacterized protein LOC131620959 isoform X2 n=1 Tax=Vicia villosa TaxID=3911 RepID=UPI00273BE910|nr:uncharacterized protein LOC131620959 isoform X2 [Vicia villosa]
MNCLRLSIRILSFPGVSLICNVNILCKKSGLVAELSYKSSYSFLGLGGTIKDTNSGKVKVIYDANEVISWLKAPIAKETEAVWQTESAVIWDRGIPLSVQRNVPCFDYCALARRSTCFIQGLASFSNWSRF